MKKCPKCEHKTLETKQEAMKKIHANIHSVGDYCTYGYSRIMDEWSLISVQCHNPKCKYIV